MSLNFYLQKVYRHQPLSEAEAAAACEILTQQERATAVTGAFLAGLAMRGESTEELVGMAQNLQKRTATLPDLQPCFDILSCGTANSCAAVVLGASLLASCAGLKVAKLMTDSTFIAQKIRPSIKNVAGGIGLIAATGISSTQDSLHSAGYALLNPVDYMETIRAMAVHQETLPLPCVFDRLFPLIHPAHLSGVLIGMAPRQTAEAMANAIRRLRLPRAVVLATDDDSCPFHHAQPISFIELNQGRIMHDTLSAADFGLPLTAGEMIDESDTDKQVAWLRSFIDGKDTPINNAILWTCALALLAGGRVGSIPEGITLSRQTRAAGTLSGVVAMIAHAARKAPTIDSEVA